MRLKKLLSSALVFVFIFTQGQFSWGQQPPQESNTQLAGTRKQIATIIFCGLGSAILGLSTLSFYGRPQDKLSNIAVGFAIGIIGGTVFATYRAATEPSELYGPKPQQPTGFIPDSGRYVSDISKSQNKWPATLELSWTF